MQEVQPDSGDADRPTRYAAFISYSHRDRKWAEWLHRGIENFRVPKELSIAMQASGSALPPLRPVFLDRAELPSSSDLAATVRLALEESAFLIVICSPDAAKSRWVNEEIRAFKSLGRDMKILCLIVSGKPSSSMTDASRADDCFPAALRFKVDNGQVTSLPAPEPLAADVRTGNDDRQSARLKIIAGLLGVPFDRLRQREHTRRQRQLAIIATASAVGCIAFGVLAAAALIARYEENRQRIIADQQSLTARRTADFLKSLFIVSNPSEARGNSITAREVLDRGVRQVGEQLKDEPLVRADLTTTLGDVYTNLGLLKEAEDLLTDAHSVPAQPKDVSAREALALGEVQYQRGENEAALASLQEALALVEQSSGHDPLARAKILGALGDLYNSTQDYEKARQHFERALLIGSGSSPAKREVVARSLEGIAQTDFYENHLDKAATEYKTALAARIALSGELHPAAFEITDALGSLEYMRGNLTAAGGYFRRTLDAERRVLGEHDPAIGSTLNNLGRVLLEQRKFSEARALLQEALGLQSSQVAETDNDFVFIYANLALSDSGIGDIAEAESLFQKGLNAAIANKHRLQGPILTDLAELECRTGRVDQGLARLDEARPMVVETYPEDLWRAAHVDNVRAGCLTVLRKYVDAAKLIESSDPVVLKKWPPSTLYGYDAIQRSIRLYSLMEDAAKLSEYRRLAERK
jgi:tetratricopeptide (TPR) repeat protein